MIKGRRRCRRCLLPSQANSTCQTTEGAMAKDVYSQICGKNMNASQHASQQIMKLKLFNTKTTFLVLMWLMERFFWTYWRMKPFNAPFILWRCGPWKEGFFWKWMTRQTIWHVLTRTERTLQSCSIRKAAIFLRKGCVHPTEEVEANANTGRCLWISPARWLH